MSKGTVGGVPSPRRDAALAEEFGRRVRERRTSVGLSQEALADLAGVHRTFVGIIERGESGPTLATIVRLAAALDIDPGLLISGMRIVGEPS